MTKKQVKTTTKEISKSLTDEELALYINFLFSNEKLTDKQESKIKEIANKYATVSDATVIANYSVRKVEHMITQIMDKVQVQDILLRELGVTQEQYEKAREEYNDGIQARMDELKSQLEDGASGK